MSSPGARGREAKKYKGRIPGAELLGAIARAALQGEVELDITRFDDRELVGACDLIRDVSPELCERIRWEANLREAWKHFLRNHPELESEELRFEG